MTKPTPTCATRPWISEDTTGKERISSVIALGRLSCLRLCVRAFPSETEALGNTRRETNTLPFTIGNCVRTVIHPNWTVVGGASRGDLALCVLKEPSNYTTVAIPKGERFQVGM